MTLPQSDLQRSLLGNYSHWELIKWSGKEKWHWLRLVGRLNVRPWGILSLSFPFSLSVSFCLFFPTPTVMWWSTEYCTGAELHIYLNHGNPTGTFIVIYMTYNYPCWLPVMPRYLTQRVYEIHLSLMPYRFSVAKFKSHKSLNIYFLPKLWVTEEKNIINFVGNYTFTCPPCTQFVPNWNRIHD